MPSTNHDCQNRQSYPSQLADASPACHCDNLPQPIGQAAPDRLSSLAVSPNARQLKVDIAIGLALALIALLGYKFSPFLLPKADLTLSPPPGCDLHRQSCGAELPGGGRIELAMAPQPIPLVRPFRVEATVSGIKAGKVEIDFAGVSMNMGLNRPALQEIAPGRFAGEAMLPVCVTGRMAWQATLLVETDRQRIALPFRFDTPGEGS